MRGGLGGHSRGTNHPLPEVWGLFYPCTQISFDRPAGYGLVDLFHQPPGLRQGHDNFLIVHEVGRRLPTPVVLQSLLADLVAAHVKLPDLLGDALEVLRLVDVNVACLAFLDRQRTWEALLLRSG